MPSKFVTEELKQKVLMIRGSEALRKQFAEKLASKLNVPMPEKLGFSLEDKSGFGIEFPSFWVMPRNSGTEPKIRIYFEMPAGIDPQAMERALADTLLELAQEVRSEARPHTITPQKIKNWDIRYAAFDFDDNLAPAGEVPTKEMFRALNRLARQGVYVDVVSSALADYLTGLMVGDGRLDLSFGEKFTFASEAGGAILRFNPKTYRFEEDPAASLKINERDREIIAELFRRQLAQKGIVPGLINEDYNRREDFNLRLGKRAGVTLRAGTAESYEIIKPLFPDVQRLIRTGHLGLSADFYVSLSSVAIDVTLSRKESWVERRIRELGLKSNQVLISGDSAYPGGGDHGMFLIHGAKKLNSGKRRHGVPRDAFDTVSEGPEGLVNALEQLAESLEAKNARRSEARKLDAIDPTKTQAWQVLKQDYQRIRRRHLRNLLKESNRDARFAAKYQAGSVHMYVDLSKNRIDPRTLIHLEKLAEETRLADAIQKMFSGDKINETEERAVGHVALRIPKNGSFIVDGKNVIPEVHTVLSKMKDFADRINSGAWAGYTGKRITDVVNIGIGGSDLGPVMVTEALKSYATGNVNVHSVSNIDGTDMTEKVIKKLDPETTLFIIASKTFTTQETMTNAETAKKWFLEKAKNPEAIKKHFVALSTDKEEVTKFGIDPNNMFEFWDWVGGRYSLWSAIGLSIATYIGFDNFKELLAGAHDMDEHFRTAPFDSNIPVKLALMDLWYTNFFKAQTHAILPYDQYLHRLPAYLQQAFMESNGKGVDRSGNPINYIGSPIIWGEAGTNGQHSFYQLLHQGAQMIPADFIGFSNSLNQIGDHHEKLMANFFAQPQALALGKTLAEVLAEKVERDVERDIVPHKISPGNNPTTSILINRLTPRSLGALIAMYEHQIFAEGAILNVFSYDQWGIELGKVLANRTLPSLKDASVPVPNADSSTAGLVEEFHRQRSDTGRRSGARAAFKILLADKPGKTDQIEFLMSQYPGQMVLIPEQGIGEDLTRLREVIEREQPDVVFIRSTTQAFKDREFLKLLAGKIILRGGTDTDNVDLKAAKAAGVIVARTGGAENSAANLFSRFALHFFRIVSPHPFLYGSKDDFSSHEGWNEVFDLPPDQFHSALEKSKKAGRGEITEVEAHLLFSPTFPFPDGLMLKKTKIGLLGSGRVPKVIEHKLKKLSELAGGGSEYPQLIVWSRSTDPALKKKILDEANVISLHLPGIAAKDGFILGRNELQSLANRATRDEPIAVINTSRKQLVDHGALREALRQNEHLYYFADLDFDEELISLMRDFPKQVFLTPHIGASTPDALQRVEANTLSALGELFDVHTGVKTFSEAKVDYVVPPASEHFPRSEARLTFDDIKNEEARKFILEHSESLGAGSIEFLDDSDDSRLIREELDAGGLLKVRDKDGKDTGNYYARSHEKDTARLVSRTFTATDDVNDKGIFNNWRPAKRLKKAILAKMKGALQGKMLYVIPYLMGPPGSSLSEVGIQLTDNRYVALNMIRMVRVGRVALDELERTGIFTKGVHVTGDLDKLRINQRYFAAFPAENLILSFGSAYGGNALLSKKFHALRIAAYKYWKAKQKGKMRVAEHMAMIEILDTQTGKAQYVSAAFPSASGKSNFGMMQPPPIFAGRYRIRMVSDDILWAQNKNKRPLTLNPEGGIFPVVPGTNEKTNPHMMKAIGRGTGSIYTNEAYNGKTGEIWWEGLTPGYPENLDGWLDWRGKSIAKRPKSRQKNKKYPWAHPNARATTKLGNVPVLAEMKKEDIDGYPLHLALYGGRVAKGVPLIYVPERTDDGIYDGAVMGVLGTAAASGEAGKFLRDLFAMRPFFSTPETDFIQQELDFSDSLDPEHRWTIAHVNWFLQEPKTDRFRWPGFGENIRPILWALEVRQRGGETMVREGRAKKTPIGYVPTPKGLHLEGLDISDEDLEKVLEYDVDFWSQEIPARRKFLESLGNVPARIWAAHERLEAAHQAYLNRSEARGSNEKILDPAAKLVERLESRFHKLGYYSNRDYTISVVKTSDTLVSIGLTPDQGQRMVFTVNTERPETITAALSVISGVFQGRLAGGANMSARSEAREVRARSDLQQFQEIGHRDFAVAQNAAEGTPVQFPVIGNDQNLIRNSVTKFNMASTLADRQITGSLERFDQLTAGDPRELHAEGEFLNSDIKNVAALPRTDVLDVGREVKTDGLTDVAEGLVPSPTLRPTSFKGRYGSNDVTVTPPPQNNLEFHRTLPFVVTERNSTLLVDSSQLFTDSRLPRDVSARSEARSAPMALKKAEEQLRSFAGRNISVHLTVAANLRPFEEKGRKKNYRIVKARKILSVDHSYEKPSHATSRWSSRSHPGGHRLTVTFLNQDGDRDEIVFGIAQRPGLYSLYRVEEEPSRTRSEARQDASASEDPQMQRVKEIKQEIGKLAQKIHGLETQERFLEKKGDTKARDTIGVEIGALQRQKRDLENELSDLENRSEARMTVTIKKISRKRLPVYMKKIIVGNRTFFVTTTDDLVRVLLYVRNAVNRKMTSYKNFQVKRRYPDYVQLSGWAALQTGNNFIQLHDPIAMGESLRKLSGKTVHVEWGFREKEKIRGAFRAVIKRGDKVIGNYYYVTGYDLAALLKARQIKVGRVKENASDPSLDEVQLGRNLFVPLSNTSHIKTLLENPIRSEARGKELYDEIVTAETQLLPGQTLIYEGGRRYQILNIQTVNKQEIIVLGPLGSKPRRTMKQFPDKYPDGIVPRANMNTGEWAIRRRSEARGEIFKSRQLFRDVVQSGGKLPGGDLLRAQTKPADRFVAVSSQAPGSFGSAQDRFLQEKESAPLPESRIQAPGEPADTLKTPLTTLNSSQNIPGRSFSTNLPQKPIDVAFPIASKIGLGKIQGIIESLHEKGSFVNAPVGQNQITVGESVSGVVADDRSPVVAPEKLDLHHKPGNPLSSSNVLMSSAHVGRQGSQKTRFAQLRHGRTIANGFSSVNQPARSAKLDPKRSEARGDLPNEVIENHALHQITSVRNVGSDAKPYYVIEATESQGLHKVVFGLWHYEVQHLVEKAGAKGFLGNDTAQAVNFLTSLNAFVRRAAFSDDYARNEGGGPISYGDSEVILVTSAKPLVVFFPDELGFLLQVDYFKPVQPFGTFEEEKEFYRLRRRTNRIFGWQRAAIEKTMKEAFEALNRMPFAYSAGWAHSGAPLDHLSSFPDFKKFLPAESQFEQREPDWKVGLATDHVRTYTGRDHTGYAAFKMDEKHPEYPKFVEAINTLDGVDLIDNDFGGSHEAPLKILRVMVPDDLALGDDMEAYQAWVEKKWQEIEQVSHRFERSEAREGKVPEIKPETDSSVLPAVTPEAHEPAFAEKRLREELPPLRMDDQTVEGRSELRVVSHMNLKGESKSAVLTITEDQAASLVDLKDRATEKFFETIFALAGLGHRVQLAAASSDDENTLRKILVQFRLVHNIRLPPGADVSAKYFGENGDLISAEVKRVTTKELYILTGMAEAASLAPKLTKGSIVVTDRVVTSRGLDQNKITPLQTAQLAVAALLDQDVLHKQSEGYGNILFAEKSFLGNALDYLSSFLKTAQQLLAAA